MAAHLRAGDDLGASGLSGDTDFTSSNLSSYSAGPPALVAKPQQQRGDGAGYDGGPHISYGDAEHGDDLDRQSRSSANSANIQAGLGHDFKRIHMCAPRESVGVCAEARLFPPRLP